MIRLEPRLDTPVKRGKSTAVGKRCNPSRESTKHRKGPFPPKRAYQVPKISYKYDFIYI